MRIIPTPVATLALFPSAALVRDKSPTTELAKVPATLLAEARTRLKWAGAEPAKIVGSVYFVGTKGPGCFLITGSGGHLVPNTGVPGSQRAHGSASDSPPIGDLWPAAVGRRAASPQRRAPA